MQSLLFFDSKLANLTNNFNSTYRGSLISLFGDSDCMFEFSGEINDMLDCVLTSINICGLMALFANILCDTRCENKAKITFSHNVVHFGVGISMIIHFIHANFEVNYSSFYSLFLFCFAGIDVRP